MIGRIVVRRLGRWTDRRLGLVPVTRAAVAKVFPDHWSFMLGEIALYSFMVLVITGVYLSLFFEPSTTDRVYAGTYAPLAGSVVSSAYASTVELSWDVPVGLLVRQTHHWAALLFVGAIVLHLCRIFFTGAFRRPREVNWLVGVTMLLLAMLNGFTGYSLPDDLLSGAGLRIASAVLLSVPVVGTWASFLVFGGEFPADEVVARMFVVHVLLVPGALVALIGVHMAVLVRQKHAQFPGPGRRDSNVVGSRMWPTYAFRSISLLSAVGAVAFLLGGLVQINPVWLWGPFDPALVTSPAHPDWYVGWMEGALRIYPPWEIRVFGYLVPQPFFVGVLLPGLTFLVLFLWPWIDKRLTGDRDAHHVLDRPRARPARVAVGAWALTFYFLLLLAASDDVLARLLRVPVRDLVLLFRIAVPVLPFVVAATAWWLARRLRASGAQHLATMRAQDLVPERPDSGEESGQDVNQRPRAQVRR